MGVEPIGKLSQTASVDCPENTASRSCSTGISEEEPSTKLFMVPNTTIIAEIGVNHNGNFKTAKRLIKVAKDIGADYAKFQKRSNKELLSDEQYDILKKEFTILKSND